jgi:hypothetical protein
MMCDVYGDCLSGKFLICYFIFYFWSLLIWFLKYEKYRKMNKRGWLTMNGARRSRCSLGWMSIHTATTTSLIICDHLRQRTWGKRTSTFSSQHLVSDSHVCGSIFTNCPSTPMMRPPNSIKFTINFTPPWIYYKFYLFFLRYTRAFCLNLFRPVMFANNMQTQCRRCTWAFLTICSTYRKDDYDWGHAVLSCLYFNISRSCLEPADCIADLLLLLQMWSWTQFPIGRSR